MAAGATYEPIATTTISGTGTTTFSSIAASWTDLRLVFVGTVATSGPLGIRFNGDTATNYSRTHLLGDGSAAASGRVTSQTSIQPTTSSSTTVPTLLTVDVFSYAGSTNKTALLSFSNDTNGAGVTESDVGLWRSTSAITSLTLFAGSNISGTATLYGIKAA